MADVAAARGAGAGASPSSSPRLPSPPPLPELQLGPHSPSINAAPSEFQLDSVVQADDGASRRIRPGTSAVEMAKGPPFVPLHQVESPFQLQEYLKSYYCKLTRDEAANTVRPITRETAMELTTPPTQQDTGEPVDRNLWLYELCRFLVQRSNRLIVAFFSDSPPCSNQTCPEMRASEWQYLCAVHEPPKSCCAIDYCCHTLDWAGNVLTSPRHFPSRLSLGGEGGNIHQSMKQLVNIFRRVYRIFAHAWFQHREVFWSIEQEEGLYKFFKTVCDAYSLIPDDGYTIPTEAEDERYDIIEETPVNPTGPSFAILRDETGSMTEQIENIDESNAASSAASSAATTRRHRHTPSTGTKVTVIAEGAEEEEEDSAGNTTQIYTEPVQPDSAATSTTQTDNTAPVESEKPTSTIEKDLAAGKSRIELPPQTELVPPADPTPTAGQYTSDPFDSSPEPESVATASTSSTDSEPINTPASSESESATADKSGSFKTVEGDTLSGILEHQGDEEKPASESVSATNKESVGTTKVSEDEVGSDDEDFGEIKLPDKKTAQDETSSTATDKEEESKTTSVTAS